jgi:hypothetical protein
MERVRTGGVRAYYRHSGARCCSSGWRAHVLPAKPCHAHFFAEGSRQGHFFGFALYLDLSRDARPLPRGLTGHVAHPLRSILHRGLPGALLCAALGKPGRSFTRVTALAQERPRRLVIGHVLLRGHARNGAADHVWERMKDELRGRLSVESETLSGRLDPTSSPANPEVRSPR